MAKFQFEEWLLLWLLDTHTFHFDWDDGNRDKNALKHRVSQAEVEEVFRVGMALPLGIQISPKVFEERLAVIGPTAQNRNLIVVFALRNLRVRPISARPPNEKEKRAYEKALCEIAARV